MKSNYDVRKVRDLLARLEELGVRISANDGRLNLDAPKGALDADLRRELQDNKAAILLWLEARGGVSGNGNGHKHASREYPLSFAQQRLWFIDRLTGGNAAYNLFKPLRLEGPFQPDLFIEAYNLLIRKHSGLRANFLEVEGKPGVILRDAQEAGGDAEIIDLTALSPAEQEQRLRQAIAAEVEHRFDLERDPLLRLRILRLGDSTHVLLCNTHHIVADGWSFGIWKDELERYYTELSAGRSPEPESLRLEYGEFARLQQERYERGEFDSQLAYWKQQLRELPDLRLPLDHPRPRRQTYNGEVLHFAVAATLYRELKKLATDQGCTLFMLLLSSFQVLLHRMSGQEDFAVAAPIANRNRAEIQDLIGLFVNTLLLRADFMEDPSFAELLAATRETCLDAYDNQDCPFEKVIDEIGVRRRLDRPPAAQALFTMEREVVEDIRLPGIVAEFIQYSGQTTRYDLELHVVEHEGRLEGFFIWNRDLFDRESIENLNSMWMHLMPALPAHLQTPVSALPLLAPDREAELNAHVGDVPGVPPEHTIPALFAEQVRRTPEGIALKLREESLSYAELDRRANAIMAELQARGLDGLEAPVALCLERSPDMIAALLAVLKAGGYCVNLAPDDPPERLRYMLENAGCAFLLHDDAGVSAATAGVDGLTSIHVGEVDATDSEADMHVLERLRSHHAAYALYTSGSTGEPRGVLIEHKNVVRLVRDNDFMDFSPERVFLCFGAYTFDVTIFEIWGALLNGGTVVLHPPGRISLDELGETIRTQGVDTVWLTAALLHRFLEHNLADLQNVRYLLGGGDVLSPAHIIRARDALPSAQIINGYGPTENCVFTACHRVGPDDHADRPVPIGRPVRGTRCYVLDSTGRRVPPGIVGELYAGGDGVAREYLRRPDLNAEKFLMDPFVSEEARMYRIGDYVRLDRHGVLHFLGRKDGQVKINGYRIEQGEVENALAAAPGVVEAAVSVRESNDDKLFLAYVVPKDAAAFSVVGEFLEPPADFESTLRAHLRRRLPDYMLPARIVYLAGLPLNRHGKTDRRALPTPPTMRSSAAAGREPRNEMERRLRDLWSELLGAGEFGVDDTFFEVGGNSLLVMRLLARIKAEFGRKIPASDFFERPTIAGLAPLLDADAAGKREGPRILVPLNPGGDLPPFFCVHPAGGSPLCYLGLSRALGSEQPFYGLQSPGFEDEHATLPGTLAEAAELYVNVLNEVQPEGPVYLGGWSVGGLTALEMARLLQSQGRHVAYLALFDAAPAPFYLNIPAPEFYNNYVGGLKLQLDLGRTRGYEELAAQFRYMGVPLPDPGGVSEDEDLRLLWQTVQAEMPRLQRVQAAAHIAYFSYFPEPYHGRVDHYRIAWNHLGEWIRMYGLDPAEDPMVGRWKPYLPEGFRVFTVPGNHFSMFDAELIEPLAEQLRAALREVRETS